MNADLQAATYGGNYYYYYYCSTFTNIAYNTVQLYQNAKAAQK